jgi:hypothetical protein
MGDHTNHYRWMKACYDNSDKQVAMQYYLSKAALKSGKYLEALKYAEPAFKAYANDLQCTLHYVNCLLANGLADTALKIIEIARKVHSLDQHLLALQATCWRLLGDERYYQLYDYEQFVLQLPLGIPNGWSRLENYIDDLEVELDEEHRYKSHPFFLSVRNGSQLSSITSFNRTAMRAFSEACEEPMADYLSKLKETEGFLQSRNTGAAKLFSAWSVKLFSDGFHVNHVHQQGWLSSACHIRTASSGDSKEIQNGKAGWFKLGEPGPLCEPELCSDKYIQPRRGHIVIFPSYVWHGTVPIRGNIDRLTVAADFLPA